MFHRPQLWADHAHLARCCSRTTQLRRFRFAARNQHNGAQDAKRAEVPTRFHGEESNLSCQLLPYFYELSGTRREGQFYAFSVGLCPCSCGRIEYLQGTRSDQTNRRLGFIVQICDQHMGWSGFSTILHRATEITEHYAFDWQRRFVIGGRKRRLESKR